MILSTKHQMMRKLFRQFAETEFTTELLDELENTGEFNWDIHNKMAKYGFMGTKTPVEYGGQGGDSLPRLQRGGVAVMVCQADEVKARTAVKAGDLKGLPLPIRAARMQVGIPPEKAEVK